MTDTLALAKLYTDVATWFGERTSASLAIPYVTGTSAISVSGTPTAAAELVVLIVAGGTVGTPGITYRVGIDGEWGDELELGAATSILVSAVGLTFDLGAGTLIADNYWSARTWAPVAQPFGWREPTKHLGGDSSLQISWTPGGPTGDLGRDGPAKWPGGMGNDGPERGSDIRPIATLYELCTLTLRAYDASAPEDELVQYKAARTLYDALRAALYKSAHGTFTIESQGWLVEKKERRHGATIQLVIALQAMIAADPAEESTTTMVGAEITASELDLNQLIIIEEQEPT